EREARRVQTARAQESERARALRELRIGQDVEAVELDQERRVTDPGQRVARAVVAQRAAVVRHAGERRDRVGVRDRRPEATCPERLHRPEAGPREGRIGVGESVLAVVRRLSRHGTADARAPRGHHEDCAQQRPPGAPRHAQPCSPAGNSTTNIAPPSARFSAYSRPPCWPTMPYETDRPRPLPSPGPLVVKNGSKMRESTCAAMPGPVSSTSITTRRSRGCIRTVSTRSPDCRVIAWCAFCTRLSNTCCIWFSSAHTLTDSSSSRTTRILSSSSW